MSIKQACVSFVDLDETLFSSRRRHSGKPALVPAAKLRCGEWGAYSSQEQRLLFSMLLSQGACVPVTGRTVDSFNRVVLDFNSEAVCNHGATILLSDRTLCESWRSRQQRVLGPVQSMLNQFLDYTASFKDRTGRKFDARLMTDQGIGVYVNIKHPLRLEEELEFVVRERVLPWVSANRGFRLLLNGNNATVLAPGVSKLNAVRYLIDIYRRKNPECVFLGAGDSCSDAEFLEACDFAIIPSNTQLFQAMSSVSREFEK